MIGFLHIPKTGGTSLRTAFETAGYRVWRPHGARYTTCVPEPPPVADVVTGHIPFDVFSELAVDMWVTVLRDPVDRWLSHHFAEAGDPDPQPVPDNLTCRMLTNLDTVDVDAALTNLARFDHVGLTDRLVDTFAWFGLEPRYERHSTERSDVPAWLSDAAHDANQFDLQLYEEAQREP